MNDNVENYNDNILTLNNNKEDNRNKGNITVNNITIKTVNQNFSNEQKLIINNDKEK
jgi:hypothetical protein